MRTHLFRFHKFAWAADEQVQVVVHAQLAGCAQLGDASVDTSCCSLVGPAAAPRAAASGEDQDGLEISFKASAAGRICAPSTAKSPSATMPTSRLLRSTTGRRRT